MKRLLMTYHMPDESLVSFKGKVDFVYPTEEEMSWDLATIKEKLNDCDAFLAIGHKIDKDLLDSYPNLKVVANLGVGYDNIDWKYAPEKGVCVVNTPTSVTQPTAELTISVMLNMLRNIYNYEADLRSDLTCRNPLFPVGVTMAYGKTLGIVGFGRIGKAVAVKAKGLGMKIQYSDVFRAPEDVEKELGATYVSFEELLKTSDVVTVHSPLMPETYHMFGAEQFKMMKNTAYLCNVARGPIVCEADLIEALKNGEIAGAACDVHEFEPKVNPELAAMKHVALSPHIGSNAYDARINMVVEAVSGMIDCLNGVKPNNIVNPTVLG